MAQPARNQNLDLIKLISCVAVVMLHCLYTTYFAPSSLVYHLCAFAVPCFFMSSGYILLNKSSVSWRYVGKKLLSIIWIVVMWNIIISSVSMVKQLSDGTGIATVLIDLAKQMIRGLFQRGIMWSFWYLGATAILYLSLPLLHKLLGRVSETPRRALTLWSVFFACSVAVQTLCLVKGRPVHEPVHQTLRLWSLFQYFLLGGLMPAIVKWLEQRLTVRMHLILAAVLTLLSLGWRLYADLTIIHSSLVESYYDDLPTILWIAMLFSGLMRVKPGKMLGRIVTWATPLTMGVYIIHVPLRNWLRGYLDVVGSVKRMGFALLICAVSFLLTYLLRKIPFGKNLTQI